MEEGLVTSKATVKFRWHIAVSEGLRGSSHDYGHV